MFEAQVYFSRHTRFWETGSSSGAHTAQHMCLLVSSIPPSKTTYNIPYCLWASALYKSKQPSTLTFAITNLPGAPTSALVGD